MVSTAVRCSLLASMIGSLMTVLSANSQLDGPGQIRISPQTGVPGETFIASCSSAAIGPRCFPVGTLVGINGGDRPCTG